MVTQYTHPLINKEDPSITALEKKMQTYPALQLQWAWFFLKTHPFCLSARKPLLFSETAPDAP